MSDVLDFALLKVNHHLHQKVEDKTSRVFALKI